MARKVLIIDDDRWIAMSTAMVLEAEGFEVFSALGGADGMRMARQLRPSVILLDIMMPGIDGWETLERIKQDADLAGVPIIVFTAREYSHGRSRSRDLGAVEFFRKPFRPEALIQAIRKHAETTAAAL